MSSDEMVNIQVLRDFENPDFMSELEDSGSTLKPRQSNQFFSVLLGHFHHSVPEEIGNAILITISKVICISDILTEFLRGEFHLQLPYKRRQFADGIFDIMYIIVNSAPSVFDDRLSKCFRSIVKRNPKKALKILAMYSSMFNEIDNPWSMVDILIYEAGRFANPQTAAYYAKLLAFLCRNFPDYCKERASNCWQEIGLLLKIKDIQVLQSVYIAMFSITDVYEEAEAPISFMIPHIDKGELRDSVLTLLLAAPPVSSPPNGELLEKLVHLSAVNHNAALVLMKMARNVNFAQFLIENASLWMMQEMPTFKETLRLFLVVFEHEELHDIILSCDYFVSFLTTCASKADEFDIIVICAVLRRVMLTEDFVGTQEFNEFMKVYFDTATNPRNGSNVTPNSVYSAILLTSTVAMIGYINCFSSISKEIARIIKKGDDISGFAVNAALVLCSYPKCINIFIREDLLSYLKNNHMNFPEKMKQSSTKLIQAMQDY